MKLKLFGSNYILHQCHTLTKKTILVSIKPRCIFWNVQRIHNIEKWSIKHLWKVSELVSVIVIIQTFGRQKNEKSSIFKRSGLDKSAISPFTNNTWSKHEKQHVRLRLINILDIVLPMKIPNLPDCNLARKTKLY